ncbi:hypothetical protein JCM15519_18210 [Fundidesulfovibrio butyratiphilus]
MEALHPSFEREHLVLANARQVLDQDDAGRLEAAYGELLTEYETLLDRVKRVTELALTIQVDLETAIDQVEQLSQVDGLTGALNRRAFERLLSRDWAQSQREGAPISLLVVNVDNFASFNAIYSSLDGDACLKAVAQAVMRSLYREVDMVGRMEGDTFAALLPGTNEDGAALVAERAAREVKALEIPHLESPHGGIVTVSVGAATLIPSRTDTPMRLVRMAQSALGEAKSHGRDAVACAPRTCLD